MNINMVNKLMRHIEDIYYVLGELISYEHYLVIGWKRMLAIEEKIDYRLQTLCTETPPIGKQTKSISWLVSIFLTAAAEKEELLKELINWLINYNGVCRAAPVFARVY